MNNMNDTNKSLLSPNRNHSHPLLGLQKVHLTMRAMVRIACLTLVVLGLLAFSVDLLFKVRLLEERLAAVELKLSAPPGKRDTHLINRENDGFQILDPNSGTGQESLAGFTNGIRIKHGSRNKREANDRRHSRGVKKRRMRERQQWRKIKRNCVKDVVKELGTNPSGEFFRATVAHDIHNTTVQTQGNGSVVNTLCGAQFTHDGAVLWNQSANRYYCFWEAAPESSKTFKLDVARGEVQITRRASHLVYAQIVYYGDGPRASFRVEVRRAGTTIQTPLATCITSPSPHLLNKEQSSDPHLTEEYHMCATSVVAELRTGDVLRIVPLSKIQQVVTNPTLTYWWVTTLG